jgi:hypothetical protein
MFQLLVRKYEVCVIDPVKCHTHGIGKYVQEYINPLTPEFYI